MCVGGVEIQQSTQFQSFLLILQDQMLQGPGFKALRLHRRLTKTPPAPPPLPLGGSSVSSGTQDGKEGTNNSKSNSRR